MGLGHFFGKYFENCRESRPPMLSFRLPGGRCRPAIYLWASFKANGLLVMMLCSFFTVAAHAAMFVVFSPPFTYTARAGYGIKRSIVYTLRGDPIQPFDFANELDFTNVRGFLVFTIFSTYVFTFCKLFKNVASSNVPKPWLVFVFESLRVE